MSKQTIKDEINLKIRTNGEGLITGQMMNDVLNHMVDDYGEQEKLSELQFDIKGLTETSNVTEGYNADVYIDVSLQTNDIIYLSATETGISITGSYAVYAIKNGVSTQLSALPPSAKNKEYILPTDCDRIRVRLVASRFSGNGDITISIWSKNSTNGTIRDIGNAVSKLDEYGKRLLPLSAILVPRSGYVSSDGSIIESNNFGNTGFLKVFAGDFIDYKVYINRGACYVAFYTDKNLSSFVSAESLINSDGGSYSWRSGKWLAQRDGYIIISARSEQISDSYLYFNNSIDQEEDLADIVRLSNLIEKKTQVGSASSGKCFSLLHFTDPHTDEVNLKRIGDFIAKYSSYIDVSVCTGDMNGSSYDEPFDFWSNKGLDSTLFALGNHDVHVGTETHSDDTFSAISPTYPIVSQSRAFSRYFEPYYNNWGAVVTSGKTYYYKDFASYGIRLIVLDLHYWDTSQKNWFDSTLSSAKTNGYAVIVAQHYPMATFGERIKCNFTSVEWAEQGNTHINGEALNSVSSFITNGGEFICWLNGHTHFDIVEKSIVGDSVQIAIDCNTASHHLPCDGQAVEGTESQDCFNVISVDTTDKVLRIIRIGRKYSRYMQHRDSIAIRYTTGEVLAQC